MTYQDNYETFQREEYRVQTSFELIALWRDNVSLGLFGLAGLIEDELERRGINPEDFDD